MTPTRVALVRGSWHSVWEPLALGYLYSYTKDLPNVEYIYMGDGAFDSETDVITNCAEADVVGFSGTTSQMPWSLRVADKIKERNPETTIYVGGYGPSVDPSSFVEHTDGVVVGEGERPWRTILSSAPDSRPRGIVMEPPILDLDSIPFPDRDFIKVERCIGVAKREEGRRVTGILGNRGCLRRCKFCADGSAKTIYGVKLRERSPLDILTEMKLVERKYGIEFFKFADPEVNTRPGRIKELCETFIEYGWDIPWGGNFLAGFDEKEAHMLHKAGCREAWIGLESGNLDIHRHIGKGVTPTLIRKSFKAAKDAGILRRAYVLLGVPPETKDTIKDTENLIDEVQPDTVGFSVLVPYPGTSYADPLRDSNIDWSTADEYGGPNLPWHPDTMTRDELLSERWRLVEKYASKRPKIIQKKMDLGIIAPPEAKVISSEEIQLTDFRPDNPNGGG